MKTFNLFCVVFIGVIGIKYSNAQAAAPNPFSKEQLNCIANCPRISNYNPVCGTDGFLYENQAHLNCAVRCNHAVQVNHGGRCQPFLNPPKNQNNQQPQQQNQNTVNQNINPTPSVFPNFNFNPNQGGFFPF